MLHQRLTHIAPPTLHQRKHAGMQAQRQNCRLNRLRHNLCRAGMGGMALDHHRAACRQCRGSVTARRGKRERKVGGTEHRNRANRPLHHVYHWPGGGFAVGLCGVKTAVQIIALADMGGEQAQLARGAALLALQPCRGQAGFRGADGSDFNPARLDLICDAVKEGGALVAGQGGITGEGRFGGLHSGIDMGRGADAEGLRLARGGGGLEGGGARNPLACDKVFSGQHGASLKR